MKYSIIFFGSFQRYSTVVLKKLIDEFNIESVITTPPKPQGRGLTLEKTDTHRFAESQDIPAFTPENLPQSPQEILQQTPDFIVVAGYGKLLPPSWLAYPKVMAINLHPSLLPKYRGRAPAEWAILNGDRETGVTLIKMSPKFDTGEIIAQDKVSLLPTDTTDILYEKLFKLGADLLLTTLPTLDTEKPKLHLQSGTPSYARVLTRQDGYIPWNVFQKAIRGQPINPGLLTPTMLEIFRNSKLDLENWLVIIERMLRAFGTWPGVWTLEPGDKRMKILSANFENNKLVPTLVQEEGGKPKLWSSTNVV